MDRRLFLLIPLLLAACAPVVYLTPSAGGDVLPVEAQRVIDRATASAAVMATQAAQATATGQSARETATGIAQGTLGALAAQQTQVGLQLTQSAAQGAATDAAAVRTQAAAQSQAWSTPTAAAVASQAALTADQARQRAENAASAGEFWRTLRAVIVVLVVVGGLTAIAIAAFDRYAKIELAKVAGQAAIAREAFRLLAPGHWAEWRPAEGYQVYQLPGPLDEPATIIEQAMATPNQAHALRQAVRLFCWWGDMYGFGIRDLGPEGAGVVTDPVYRRLAKLLRGLGVLGDITLPDGRGTKTGWINGYTYRQLAEELGAGRLALPPCPPGESPPKVAFAVPTQHHN